MNLSPSENYARIKANSRFPKTRKFAESFPFELDEFQINACHALESGKGVLVAAPTGAGKTMHVSVLSFVVKTAVPAQVVSAIP